MNDIDWTAPENRESLIAASPETVEAGRALLAAVLADLGIEDDPDAADQSSVVCYGTVETSSYLTWGHVRRLRAALDKALGK